MVAWPGQGRPIGRLPRPARSSNESCGGPTRSTRWVSLAFVGESLAAYIRQEQPPCPRNVHSRDASRTPKPQGQGSYVRILPGISIENFKYMLSVVQCCTRKFPKSITRPRDLLSLSIDSVKTGTKSGFGRVPAKRWARSQQVGSETPFAAIELNRDVGFQHQESTVRSFQRVHFSAEVQCVPAQRFLQGHGLKAF